MSRADREYAIIVANSPDFAGKDAYPLIKQTPQLLNKYGINSPELNAFEWVGQMFRMRGDCAALAWSVSNWATRWESDDGRVDCDTCVRNASGWGDWWVLVACTWRRAVMLGQSAPGRWLGASQVRRSVCHWWAHLDQAPVQPPFLFRALCLWHASRCLLRLMMLCRHHYYAALPVLCQYFAGKRQRAAKHGRAWQLRLAAACVAGNCRYVITIPAKSVRVCVSGSPRRLHRMVYITDTCTKSCLWIQHQTNTFSTQTQRRLWIVLLYYTGIQNNVAYMCKLIAIYMRQANSAGTAHWTSGCLPSLEISSLWRRVSHTSEHKVGIAKGALGLFWCCDCTSSNWGIDKQGKTLKRRKCSTWIAVIGDGR